MRIGLAGTGRIGGFHASTLAAMAAVSEVVVADVAHHRAEALARELSVREAGVRHAPLDRLYAEPLDGVVIATATSAHAELLHQAIDHEVPAFCEKPVALDIPTSREVVQHAEAAGVPVQMGFQRRFDAGYNRVREAVDAGELGRIHTLRAVTGDVSPPPAQYLPTSGGLFRDCGIHDFDIMRWVTGREVLSVHAFGANGGATFFRGAGDVDTYVAVLRFEGDLLATVTATRYNGAGHDVRLEVCGELGGLVVGLDDRAALHSAEPSLSWQQQKPYATFLERFHDAYVAEMAHFVEMAAGRAVSPCSPTEALEALYVAEACDLSARTGLPVQVASRR